MEGRAIDTIGYSGMHSLEVALDNWYVPGVASSWPRRLVRLRSKDAGSSSATSAAASSNSLRADLGSDRYVPLWIESSATPVGRTLIG
jgi:hypothetical protein